MLQVCRNLIDKEFMLPHKLLVPSGAFVLLLIQSTIHFLTITLIPSLIAVTVPLNPKIFSAIFMASSIE